MLRRGEVKSYAELAAIGRVSRSRLSQIMALLDLAPSIQEELLAMLPVKSGDDSVTERRLRSIAFTIAWDGQIALWFNVLHEVKKVACADAP
jgi:hypothetical protein